NRPGLLQRMAAWMWPRAGWRRAGWRRAGRYLLVRVRRLPGTPHAIAAGLATGVAVALTLFLGLHLALAVALAWLTGGNLLGAGGAAASPGTPGQDLARAVAPWAGRLTATLSPRRRPTRTSRSSPRPVR